MIKDVVTFSSFLILSTLSRMLLHERDFPINTVKVSSMMDSFVSAILV